MTNVSFALKKLNDARMERDALLHVHDYIERTEGVGCARAETLTTDKVNPSHDSVTEAESALIKAQAKSMPEMLSKLAALIHEGMMQEDLDILRAEAATFLDTEKDPIVPLCRRWLNLNRAKAKMIDECPTGDFDGPDLIAAFEQLNRLEAEVLRLTPTSPEGVALLAEMQLVNEGPDTVPGSDEWLADMNNPQFLVMRRLAHGARIVAGESA